MSEVPKAHIGENIGEKRPFHTVKWNDSTCEIYPCPATTNPSTASEIIYGRSDFPIPVQRVQITTNRVSINGEDCTEFSAGILIDKTRNERQELSRKMAAMAVPDDGRDYRLTIEKTRFSDVHKVTLDGNQLLVWFDSHRSIIVISNNLKLQAGSVADQTKATVEVRPPADGTIDKTQQLDAFFITFMRTVDFASGLEDDPRRQQLRRLYAIGKEEYGQQQNIIQVVRGVGHTVLGSKPTGSNTNTGERGSSSGESLPEVDIVKSKVSLGDVGGLEQVKATLRDIAISFRHPEIMKKWGAKRPQGVLMHGAPGTGKTMLAEALAHEIEAEMWALQTTDIYEKWLGDSEQHIKGIFERARKHRGRLVLFFDEFDSIVGITEGPTPGGADNARNAVAGIFKQEMNTLSQENPDVLVVAATNNLDRIDPALIRSGRFDYKVYIPMPDEDARLQIITNVVARSMLSQEIGDFRIYGDDIQVAALANETDNMSGADISEVFRRLCLARAMTEARAGEQQTPITQAEIVHAIRGFRTRG